MVELTENLLHCLHKKYWDLKQLIKKSEALLECEIRWDMSEIKSGFIILTKEIDNLMKTTDIDSMGWCRLLAMKGVLLNLESELLLTIKDPKTAIESLVENCKLLLSRASSEYIAYIYLQTIRTIAQILENEDELSSAQELLETSFEVYENVNDLPLYDYDDIFSKDISVKPREDLSFQFNKIFSTILDMLRKIYESQGDTKSRIKTQHALLKIQLLLGDGSLLIWLQNLMQFANELATSEYFECARHHLAAVTYKLETLKKIFASKNDKIVKDEVKSTSSILEGLEAELASVWIKYGITLFLASKKKHLELFCSKQEDLNSEFNEDGANLNLSSSNSCVNEKTHIGECKPQLSKACALNEENNREKNTKITLGKQDPEINGLKFTKLDLENIEGAVRSDLIEDTNQAKDLFDFILSWIAKAGDYFDCKEFPIEYISLMLDLSELHKCYAFFEPELPQRYTIHLKRQSILDSLTRMTGELDETVYIDAHIEVARELAQVHLDLLNSDLHRLRELKSIALSRLQLNTQSYHLEQQLKISVEELETHTQPKAIHSFQPHSSNT